MMAQDKDFSRFETILDVYERNLLEAADSALSNSRDVESLAEEARLLIAAAVSRNGPVQKLSPLHVTRRRRVARPLGSPVNVRLSNSRQEGLRASFSVDPDSLDENGDDE